MKSFIKYSFIVFSFIISPAFYSGCEKDISTSAPEEEIPQGFLFVESQPSGSAIYLNDKNTGRLTPGLVPYLEEGNYKLSLKRKYFRDTSFTVTLTKNDTSTLFVDFTKNPTMLGRLSFNSSPVNADVYLNDSLLSSKTPFSISGLIPGKYNVKLKLFNHRESDVEVIVESNKNSTAYSVLRDTSQWLDFQVSNSDIQSNMLTCISADNNNVKWIGTANTGLIRYNETEFINFNMGNSQILSNQINCIAVKNDNSVWVGTNNGLSIFSNGIWNNYRSNNSDLPNDNINSIVFDASGVAWVGTNNGFSRFDGSAWQNFNYVSPKFEYLWVTDLAYDQTGNLWIGSNNFGILKFDGNNFEEYPDSVYNFLTDRITSMDVDNVNRLWIGQQLTSLERGGLSIFNGTNSSNLYLGTINNRINFIYTSQNTKWICTNEGLARYDNNNSSTFFSTLNSYLSSDNVTGVVRDKNNIIWITTLSAGLNKLKGY